MSRDDRSSISMYHRSQSCKSIGRCETSRKRKRSDLSRLATARPSGQRGSLRGLDSASSRLSESNRFRMKHCVDDQRRSLIILRGATTRSGSRPRRDFCRRYVIARCECFADSTRHVKRRKPERTAQRSAMRSCRNSIRFRPASRCRHSRNYPAVIIRAVIVVINQSLTLHHLPPPILPRFVYHDSC